MKRRSFFILTLLLLASIMVTGCLGGKTTKAKDEKKVKEVLTEFVQSLDAETMANHFTVPATLNSVSFNSKEDLIAELANIFEDRKIELVEGKVEILFPNVTASITINGESTSDEPQLQAEFKKQPDGNWKIGALSIEFEEPEEPIEPEEPVDPEESLEPEEPVDPEEPQEPVEPEEPEVSEEEHIQIVLEVFVQAHSDMDAEVVANQFIYPATFDEQILESEEQMVDMLSDLYEDYEITLKIELAKKSVEINLGNTGNEATVTAILEANFISEGEVTPLETLSLQAEFEKEFDSEWKIRKLNFVED